MAALLTLRSAYKPGPPGHGTVDLRLENSGAVPVERFRLALTSTVRLDPGPDTGAQLVRQVSGYLELAPATGFVLAPGDALEITDLSVDHTTHHANDGPASAFVILEDGTTIDVHVEPMTAPPSTTGVKHERRALVRTTDDAPALVPWPAALAGSFGRHGSVSAGVRSAARLRSGSNEVGDVWRAVARAERRLHPEGPWVLGIGDDTGAGAWSVSAVTGAVAPGHYEVEIDDSAAEAVVTAGDAAGFRHGFVTIAQLLRDRSPKHVRIADGPAYEWRGLHVDLARQFFPASDVERIIDLAAWRKLNRLHLHLTDDEAWRVPIDGYPELTTVGAWRGHGLPIPPLLGSPAAATGGSYTVAEIRGWVERARELGVVIVPEVDLPGHCHAALTAEPSLRDPDDTTGAHSVQRFVDNSLCPGLPTTMPFVEAVFGALAAMFDSPWLHVGGDEVAPGAWMGSPVAAEYAKARGLAGTNAIEAAFMADVVAIGTACQRPAGGGVAGGRRARRPPAVRWVCRRVEIGRRRPRPRRGRFRRGRQRARCVLPRHGARRRLDIAWRELGRHRRARGRLRVRARSRLVRRSPATSPRRAGVRVDGAHPVGGRVRRARLPAPRRDRRAGVAGPRRRRCGVGGIAGVSAAATRHVTRGGLGIRGPCGVAHTPSSSTRRRWRSCCGRRTSTGNGRWCTP